MKQVRGKSSSCVAKSPFLPADEEKMGLTKREMIVVAETHRGNYTVWIKATENGFWKIKIHLDGQDRVYDVETTRGVTKGWRNLSDAILFAQENCKYFKSIFIEIGEWVLTKRE